MTWAFRARLNISVTLHILVPVDCALSLGKCGTSWERWCNLLLLYDIGCLLATQEPEGAGATLTFLQTTDMLSTVPTPTKQTPLLLTKSLSGLKTCEPWKWVIIIVWTSSQPPKILILGHCDKEQPCIQCKQSSSWLRIWVWCSMIIVHPLAKQRYAWQLSWRKWFCLWRKIRSAGYEIYCKVRQTEQRLPTGHGHDPLMCERLLFMHCVFWLSFECNDPGKLPIYRNKE